jgi:hypothetical protein
VLGKLVSRRHQDGRATLFRLAAGSHVALPIVTSVLLKQSGHILINQLVRLYAACQRFRDSLNCVD